MKTCLAGLLAIWTVSAAAPGTREYSVVVEKPSAEYTVEVAGTGDPENLEIVIENLGTGPLINPRLTVNGRYDWFDVKSIVAEATAGCRTDEEKALALWWWVLDKRYQLSPQDRSALHPVRAMNGYGYGICGHTSAWMKCLLNSAGIPARVQELWGHTVSEAWWDGAWHMLDANVKVFYLDRDNRTIASLATLERDGGLIARGIHPRDPWERRPDPKERNDEFVRYITSYKDNYEEHTYDDEIAKDYTLAMTLRPGESLVRWWDALLGKHEGGRTPARYANGRLVWEPDLKRVDVLPYLDVPTWGNLSTQARDDRGPGIHVAEPQDSLYTRPSVFTIPVRSPYPIVGGRLEATLVKQGAGGLVSLFFGRPQWRRGDLAEFGEGTGTRKMDLDLDSRLRKDGVPYGYGIGFALRADATAQAGLDAFRLTTELQVSPHSLPALAPGENVVTFRHESPGPVKVRITHRWRETDAPQAPGPVTSPAFPPDGGETNSPAPELLWKAVPGAADYQVMISLRPDCRWPLSPTLYQSTGSEHPRWRVPAGFLNAGTAYYWRVRARGQNARIGPWGPVFRFRIEPRR